MEYIQVTKENITEEHICCAISNNKDVQVASKKAWLLDRFADGLVFLKSAERAFKGHGYSNDLLEACIRDSGEKGKKGLCILSAAKKKPFLADPKYLKHKGFSVSDEADNGIQLWYLPFSADAQPPVFLECAKHPHIDEAGYVLYYTSQCPFNAKYVPIIMETAKAHGIPFKAVHIESREEAQSAPSPITTYALFLDGEYLTNEQMNESKFLKLAASRSCNG